MEDIIYDTNHKCVTVHDDIHVDFNTVHKNNLNTPNN